MQCTAKDQTAKCMSQSTSANATSASTVAQPPTLTDHLALAASLNSEHFAALCAAGRELLHSPDDTQMLKKAAKALDTDVDVVGASVRALCHILVSSATAGRSADDLLRGIEVELPATLVKSLQVFYADVMAEVEREAKRDLSLPHYRDLEWRLQANLGGRYQPRQAPQPSFLLRLHTGPLGDGAPPPQQTVLRADLTSLRRLTSELDCALAEDKSKHSRRIARRL